MILNEQEKKCVELLAHLFEHNEKFVNQQSIIEQMGINGANYDVLMKTMEHLGAVEKVSTQIGRWGHITVLHPSPCAVELLREIEAEKKSMQAPVDIIDQVKKQIRQNPWTAWPIIIILGLAFLVPAINQLWELIMKIVRAFFQQ